MSPTHFFFKKFECNAPRCDAKKKKKKKNNRVTHLGLSIKISPLTQVHLFIQEL